MIKRYEDNPVLSPEDVPYECSLAFNAGVTKFKGKYVMVFRCDYGVNKNTFRQGSIFLHV